MCVDSAATQVTSLYQWHALWVVLPRIHNANGNAAFYGKKVAERHHIPIAGKFFNTCIREMSTGYIC